MHGLNAKISQAGSMFNGMSAVTKPEQNIIEPGSPVDLMRQQGPRVQNVYAETIDQPAMRE